MPEVDPAVEAIVAEAKKSFDLFDRIKNRKLREGAVTVYTDEVAGAALGGSEEMRNLLDVVTGHQRWGVLGEIAAALAEDPDADVSALREQAIDLQVELELSGLTFHLRAVPELVVKDARRQALKSYGVNGKVPDENALDFNSLFNANLLANMIVKVVDAEGAEQTGKLSVDAAADLENFLPRSEYAKLYAKLQDVQFKQAVSDSVTSSADF